MKSSANYIAVDNNNRSEVIAEGETIKSVISKADETGRDYSIVYKTKPGKTYIF